MDRISVTRFMQRLWTRAHFRTIPINKAGNGPLSGNRKYIAECSTRGNKPPSNEIKDRIERDLARQKTLASWIGMDWGFLYYTSHLYAAYDCQAKKSGVVKSVHFSSGLVKILAAPSFGKKSVRFTQNTFN